MLKNMKKHVYVAIGLIFISAVIILSFYPPEERKGVTISPMGPGDAISALKANAVDGVFLPHPGPAIVELEKAGKMVVGSGEMWPGHPCCVLLVSGKLIREHPALVEQIIRTHINATEYNLENQEEAAEIYARKVGWDVEKVKYSFEKWDGYWVHDPYIGMNGTVDFARTHYELGYIEKELTKDDLFDTTFYDRIAAGLPPLEPKPGPKHLRIGYQPSTHQAAHMTAMEKGWWLRDLEKFGVEKVTDYQFPSGPSEMTAMLAGELDVAYVGATPPITAIDKGLDAKIVAGVQVQGSHLALSPDINYTSPKDLEGLTIATFPPGSIQDTILKKWLRDNGIEVS